MDSSTDTLCQTQEQKRLARLVLRFPRRVERARVGKGVTVAAAQPWSQCSHAKRAMGHDRNEGSNGYLKTSPDRDKDISKTSYATIVGYYGPGSRSQWRRRSQ